MASCLNCLLKEQCIDDEGCTPYMGKVAAANNVEKLCLAYMDKTIERHKLRKQQPPQKKQHTKKIVQLVIMVSAMQFGFSVMYRILWLLTGLPCPIWLQMVIVLLACVTNLGFIRWCGGEENEK